MMQNLGNRRSVQKCAQKSGSYVLKVLAPQAEGWVFESQLHQIKVVKTGSDSSTTKRSTIGLSVTSPRRWPLLTDARCHRSKGTLRSPLSSLVMSAEYRSTFAAFNGKSEVSIWVKHSRVRRKTHSNKLTKLAGERGQKWISKD